MQSLGERQMNKAQFGESPFRDRASGPVGDFDNYGPLKNLHPNYSQPTCSLVLQPIFT